MTFWKRILGVFCSLCLLLGLLPVAMAEDCFTLNVDVLNMDLLNNNDYVARYLSAQTQGVRVTKYISDSSELAESVRLTLVQMDTRTLLFDKDYGYQSKTFDSDVIYLPYVDNRTIPYLITLYVGDTVYAMPFMQLQPRLEYNSACTYGIRLRDLGGGLSSDWLMGTMLDLNALRSAGAVTLDVCASNAYIIGQAYVSMQNEGLSVQLSLNAAANAEIHGLSLYVITDCAALSGDPAYLGLPAYQPGERVEVGGAASAFLYIPMQVSYDPMGLSGFGYDLSSGYQQNQLSLWQQNCQSAYAPQPELPTEAPAQQLQPEGDETVSPSAEWPEVQPEPEQPAADPVPEEQSFAEQPAGEPETVQ